MDHILQNFWFYLLGGLFLLFLLFGKSKGGVVVKGYTAQLEVLDPRFNECEPEAEYNTFKQGTPSHFEIEIEKLFLEAGEELEFHINGKLLATVKVKKNKEAEFDHWSDGDVRFPVITGGEELTVKYKNVEVLKGTFVAK